jgi:hypothetical protein
MNETKYTAVGRRYAQKKYIGVAIWSFCLRLNAVTSKKKLTEVSLGNKR